MKHVYVYNPEKGPVTAIRRDFKPKTYALVTEEEAEEIHKGGYPLLVEGKSDKFPYPYRNYTGNRKLK